jgi:hypothetical protein
MALESVPPTDAFIRWLHESREVARRGIARRDYLISLGCGVDAEEALAG